MKLGRLRISGWTEREPSSDQATVFISVRHGDIKDYALASFYPDTQSAQTFYDEIETALRLVLRSVLQKVEDAQKK
jgi:hypothetical protein